jgi:hypothetical protein
MAFFVFDKGIIKLAIAQTRLALPAGEAQHSAVKKSYPCNDQTT